MVSWGRGFPQVRPGAPVSLKRVPPQEGSVRLVLREGDRVLRVGLLVSNHRWRIPRPPHVRGCEVSAWRGCWEVSPFWRPRSPATGPRTLHGVSSRGGGRRWAGGVIGAGAHFLAHLGAFSVALMGVPNQGQSAGTPEKCPQNVLETILVWALEISTGRRGSGR